MATFSVDRSSSSRRRVHGQMVDVKGCLNGPLQLVLGLRRDPFDGLFENVEVVEDLESGRHLRLVLEIK